MYIYIYKYIYIGLVWPRGWVQVQLYSSMTAAQEGGRVVNSTPRPHFTPGKHPAPILHEAGWAPGPVWTGGKYSPHRDSIPERPACSQSLYRLSYPAYTGCPRRKGPNFGRVFLRSNCTDITQNTYIQSSMVTEILAREV